MHERNRVALEAISISSNYSDQYTYVQNVDDESAFEMKCQKFSEILLQPDTELRCHFLSETFTALVLDGKQAYVTLT